MMIIRTRLSFAPISSQNKLSPADLKPAIAEYLVKIIGPIRDKLVLNPELLQTIQKSV